MSKRGFIAMAVGFIVFGLAVLALPAAAEQPKCLIVNLGGGVGTFDSLQAAHDVAAPGDTLKVKGTCYGSTMISKNLSIVGESSPGFGTATLDGNVEGPVLRVPYQAVPPTVTVTDLTITGGIGGVSAYTGVLTLNNIRATGNSGTGVGNFSAATITLNDSEVTGNTQAAGGGGGIWNSLGAGMTLNHTTVSNNTTAGRGGGIFNRGRLTLNDSSVTGNSATSATSLGGGIYNIGSVTLNNSSVTNNSPDNCFPSIVGC